MAQRSVVMLTIGVAGSGKTYRRCAHFLLTEFLPDGVGRHWSNFPLGVVPQDHTFPPAEEGETFVDRLAVESAKRMNCDADEIRDRIKLIPADELKRWESGESGPWEFFANEDLQDCHIAIDEIHNFCSTESKSAVKQAWMQWLGEIRHRGCTVEFISQVEQKVPKEIRRECGMELRLTSCETERDPFFKVFYADWLELVGKITGRWQPWLVERYKSSALSTGHGANFSEGTKYPILPFYFQFYDSFSAPQKGGKKGKARTRQYERRSWPSLLWWFYSRNAFELTPRLLVTAVVMWLAFFGGGNWAIQTAFASMRGFGESAIQSGISGFRADAGEEPRSPGTPDLRPKHGQTIPMNQLGQGVTDDARIVSGLADADRLRADLEAMRADAEALRLAAETAEAEAQRLREEAERSAAVVLMTRDTVTFRDGFTFGIGEPIDVGYFAGTTITRIDFARRTVHFDDGRIARLGGRPASGGLQLPGGGSLPTPTVPQLLQ